MVRLQPWTERCIKMARSGGAFRLHVVIMYLDDFQIVLKKKAIIEGKS
jgi:hypothetical protein